MTMGWSVPTYSGTYMGGSPSAARTALFELCRAVNERESALGQTESVFFTAAGVEKSSVTMDDLYAIAAAGSNSLADINLRRVRDGILQLIAAGQFTSGAGGAVLTKADVETSVNFDLDTNPQSASHGAYWQALQDSLDLLRYVTVEISRDFINNSSVTGTANIGYATAQQAWDHWDDQALFPLTYTEWFVGQRVDLKFIARRAISADLHFTLPDLTGSIIGGAYRVGELNNSGLTLAYSIGAHTFSLINGASGERWASFSGAGSLTLNAANSVTLAITTPKPSTVPSVSFSASVTNGVTPDGKSLQIYVELDTLSDVAA